MRALLTLLLIAVPTAAFAHPGHGLDLGLAAGLVHPLSGLDHVLAMLAVGVLAAVLGGRALLLVPAMFVGMMMVGFAFGASGVQVPFVELGIGLSALVIAGVAAAGRKISVSAAMALVGGFALFHGAAHGAEMPASVDGLQFALGLVLATVALHGAGMAMTVGLGRIAGTHGQMLARVGAGIVAAAGVGVLAGWV